MSLVQIGSNTPLDTLSESRFLWSHNVFLTVQDDDKYFCSKCLKPYTKWQSYYVHVKYDCGKKRLWKCLVANCVFRSTRTGNLKRHIMNIHGISVDAERFMAKAN
ncbi:hypothetical protein GWI33_014877 [Rhynchophorus ferrugineus]|uniref:Uncharacterized protein n=1 Tax=Rhynchophorus ferrugineus TaxID=354439 RepID=A0A834I4X9_RHYFE|nr:hypothetical protein GWI33_014877 [Rhynchophorus ferrugineus]